MALHGETDCGSSCQIIVDKQRHAKKVETSDGSTQNTVTFLINCLGSLTLTMGFHKDVYYSVYLTAFLVSPMCVGSCGGHRRAGISRR